MSEETGAERTEPATPRRRERAVEEGQVAHSQEVSPALSMLLVLGAIAWWFASIAPPIIDFARDAFVLEGWESLIDGRGIDLVRRMGRLITAVAIPVALLTMVVAVAASLAQVGIHINFELLGLKWDRLDPSNWLRKVGSVELPVGLVKSLLKGIGVIAIAAYGLRDEPADLWRLSFRPVGELALHLQGIAFTVVSRVAGALLLIALFDVFWTRFRHDQKLRMSKQEVKEEHKESEGDPRIKQERRRRARELLKNPMVPAVEGATVVVRNPTHYAVALRYKERQDPSPRVVAKGRGHKALRIIQIAERAGVPVIEDKPLARGLYSSVKVGRTIPVELYRSVARLLAIVYRMKGVRRGVRR